VPADPSSSIPSALTQLAHADPLGPAEAPGLLTYLATIGDPRAGKGRRHPLVAILAMAAAAVLTGARSITAIAEWAADTPQPVRAALGARRDAPDRWVVPTETTIRRTFARLDAEALACPVSGLWRRISACSATVWPSEDGFRGSAPGPSAGVGAFGVVVAEVSLKVEAEPGLLGIR
jgi:hypothetical protein